MSQAIIDQAFVIVKLRKWGVAWKQIAESAKTESARLRQTVDALSQKLNNSEAESRAYFEELEEARRNACLPGEALNDAITRTDRALDTAREQRDQLRVERDSLRAEVTILRSEARSMVAEIDALRAENMPEPTHDTAAGKASAESAAQHLTPITIKGLWLGEEHGAELIVSYKHDDERPAIVLNESDSGGTSFIYLTREGARETAAALLKLAGGAK